MRFKKPRYDCVRCKHGECHDCIDVLRVAVGLDPRCPCTRKGHAGEPHGAPEHVCNEICEIVNGPVGPRWVCEECGAAWDMIDGAPQCRTCGNRTRVLA